MDWQISPPARISAINGKPFAPGDRVVTVLLVDSKGFLRRCDLHADDLGLLPVEREYEELGRWTRTIKPPESSRAEARQRIQSMEELFLSLYGILPDLADDESAEEPAETVTVGTPEGAVQTGVGHNGTPVPADGQTDAIKQVLKHVLALYLERKRILRPEGKRQRAGVQDYLHVKQRCVLEVPVPPMDAALAAQVRGCLSELTL